MPAIEEIAVAGGQVQLIAADGDFNNDFHEYLRASGLLNTGKGYSVVAVFGCQSSGKSTLLNKLFGTNFVVMDERSRKQTTLGVWASKARTTEKPIVVLDLEGTDGRERGQDKTFERQSSLFALAVADVLIVNLWEHDVGRYAGANMDLLRTVLEANLHLGFSDQKQTGNRTRILFIIRDHESNTPLDNLRGILTKDVESAWNDIDKPSKFQKDSVQSHFELHFQSLPSLIRSPDDFARKVRKLRDLFTVESESEYLGSEHTTNDVPTDGLMRFMQSIWETIKIDKDLDLPNQKELLAIYRCDEISAEVFSIFLEKLKPLRTDVTNGNTEDFGKRAGSLLLETLESFRLVASRYHRPTFLRKEEELKARLDNELKPLFTLQVLHLKKDSLQLFKSMLQKALPVDGTFCKNFFEASENAKKISLDIFLKKIASSIYDNPNNLSSKTFCEEEYNQLVDEIEQYALTEKKSQLKIVIDTTHKELKTNLLAKLVSSLNCANDSMWNELNASYNTTVSKVTDVMISRLEGYKATPSQVQVYKKELDKIALDSFIEKMKEDVRSINKKMMRRFDETFKYDEHGVLLIWEPEDDPRESFKTARDHGLNLLKLFTKVKLDAIDKMEGAKPSSGTDVDSDSIAVLLTPMEVLDAEERFLKETDNSLSVVLQAQDYKRMGGMSPLKFWVMSGAFAILGFNEFIWLLFNAWWVIIVLVIAISIYVFTIVSSGNLPQWILQSPAGPAARAFIMIAQPMLNGFLQPTGANNSNSSNASSNITETVSATTPSTASPSRRNKKVD